MSARSGSRRRRYVEELRVVDVDASTRTGRRRHRSDAVPRVRAARRDGCARHGVRRCAGGDVVSGRILGRSRSSQCTQPAVPFDASCVSGSTRTSAPVTGSASITAPTCSCSSRTASRTSPRTASPAQRSRRLGQPGLGPPPPRRRRRSTPPRCVPASASSSRSTCRSAELVDDSCRLTESSSASRRRARAADRNAGTTTGTTAGAGCRAEFPSRRGLLLWR